MNSTANTVQRETSAVPTTQIVRKLDTMPRPKSFVPQPAQKTKEGLNLEVHVIADLLPGKGLRKRGIVKPNIPSFGAFELYCDEGTSIGGTDTAPAPLSYLAAGIAFCLLTHLKGYATSQNLSVNSLRVEQKMKFQSRIPGMTADTGGQMEGVSEGMETFVLIDTPEPPEVIQRMVDVAEKACMAAQTVINAVPASTIILHNGTFVLVLWLCFHRSVRQPEPARLLVKPSTKNLDVLPPPTELERLFKTLAALDAVMSPEWEYRYYSYARNWGSGETLGSMRNGSGDEIFALFNKHGCFMKGFAHEYSNYDQPVKSFYQNVPTQFFTAVTEPAFSTENVTFCYWRLNRDHQWHYADVPLPEFDDPDGSAFLLAELDGKPESYKTFCEEYYETNVPLVVIEKVYRHEVLTDSEIHTLNDAIDIGVLRTEFDAIGYPA